MAKKSTLGSNWPKYVLQWGVLAALVFFLSGFAGRIFPKMAPADPETYCPMGGLEALTTYLSRGSLPCSMSSLQIVMGIFLAAAVILFSKLFCGFLCPIGSVGDILTKLRKALGFRDLEIRTGSDADRILRAVKYGLLFWIFYMTATASELFCKNLDPYYAVATGFKGEVTLWMSLAALGLVVVPGFFVKRFWCRYICPLGAASNTLKFWVPVLLLSLVWWGLGALGLQLPWWVFLAVLCLSGYLLEILYSKPKLQILHVVCDEDLCGKRCYSCRKNCPYNIDVPSFGPYVTSVDCTLCGECVASCPSKALSIGLVPEKKNRFGRFLPAILAVVLTAAGIYVGSRLEIPTIDENWGIEKGMRIETLRLEGITSVKCYGSSMAFKSKMEKIEGVHGVKTFVRTHTVVLKYDPAVTGEDEIREKLFGPSRSRQNPGAGD